MSRKSVNVPQNAGIDKLESFLQNYFKQVLAVIAVIVVVFIVAYAVHSINKSTQGKKADLVGQAQASLDKPTADSVQKFQDLSANAPFLKNYIGVIAGGAWAAIGENTKALNALKVVDGNYKELADSFSYDMGNIKNINVDQYANSGKMRPLWLYRKILASKQEDRAKNVALFKSLYPDSKLLTLVENWK